MTERDQTQNPPETDEEEGDQHGSYFTQDLLDQRRMIIKAAKATDYAADLQRRAAQQKIVIHPFPPIPRSLVGLIRVSIPGVPDHEAQQGEIEVERITVPLTQAVYQSHSDTAVPILSVGDTQKMMGDAMFEYWSYGRAYQAYLRTQESLYRAKEKSFKVRARTLKLELASMYEQARDAKGNKIPQATRKANTENDPVLKKWEREEAMAKLIAEHLSLQIKTVNDVVELCSRMLTSNLKMMDLYNQGRQSNSRQSRQDQAFNALSHLANGGD